MPGCGVFINHYIPSGCVVNDICTPLLGSWDYDIFWQPLLGYFYVLIIFKWLAWILAADRVVLRHCGIY